MELTFEKQGDVFVAEFEVPGDFNLHIEKPTGEIRLYQRTAGGKYDAIEGVGYPEGNSVFDYDFTALVYPKTIKVVSKVLPTYAEVTSDGEITEIKSQSKDVEIVSNGTTEVTPDAGFAYLNKVSVKTNVPQSGGGDTPSTPKWTGHADAEGLKAIGWTDEDIAYYQENGVNWNEEDDEYHKVPEDNKALYGILTEDNLGDYTDVIVYLPKIDLGLGEDDYLPAYFSYFPRLVGIPKISLGNITDLAYMFYQNSIVTFPQIDTSKVTYMNGAFEECAALTHVPLLDTSNVEDMGGMFNECYSITEVPQFDTSKVTDMKRMFSNCRSLIKVPQFNTSKVTDMGSMFYDCSSLTSIPSLDVNSVTIAKEMFYNCYSLKHVPTLIMNSLTSCDNMFFNCMSITSIPKISDNPLNTNPHKFIEGCRALVDVKQVFDIANRESNIVFIENTSLRNIYIKNLHGNNTIDFSVCPISKESILFLIDNCSPFLKMAGSTTTATIKLNESTYNKLSVDSDIIVALESVPRIILASA